MSTGMTGTVTGGGEGADARRRLDEIAGRVAACRACGLCDGRTNAVPGCGSPTARVMVVGEAPGRNEDETGVPFVGRAGERLDEVLALAGLSRDDVFVANVLKCRPPGNRDPRPDEVAACEGFLVDQLRAVSPDVVVTFGNFATRFALGTREGVTALHGRLVEGVRIGGDGGVTVDAYPVFHPAATMYRPQWRPVLEDDMRRLGALLAGRA